MGLRTFATVGKFFWGLFSSLCVTHLAGMGFDFIVIVPLLPSLCSFFVFHSGVSFFVGFQHPPVNGCSTASCDFGSLLLSVVVQQLVVILVVILKGSRRS